MLENWSWAGKCAVTFKNSVGNQLLSVEPSMRRVRSMMKVDTFELLLKSSWNLPQYGSSSTFQLCGYSALSIPRDIPSYSLADLAQTDQIISSNGKISFGQNCVDPRSGSQAASRISYSIAAKKSDAQLSAERTWLQRSAGMTRTMQECAQNIDNGYRYSSACFNLWKSFSELHSIQLNFEPNINTGYVSPASWYIQWTAQNAMAYLANWNSRSWKFTPSSQSGSVTNPLSSPFIEGSFLTSPISITIEFSPSESQSPVTLTINTKNSKQVFSNLKLFSSEFPSVKFPAPTLWENYIQTYLKKQTGNSYPATCVHQKDSVTTFDQVFYTSAAIDQKSSSYQLVADCSAALRFAVYMKRIGPDSRRFTISLGQDAVVLAPSQRSASKQSSSDKETNAISVYVNGQEVEVSEHATAYIQHLDSRFHIFLF